MPATVFYDILSFKLINYAFLCGDLPLSNSFLYLPLLHSEKLNLPNTNALSGNEKRAGIPTLKFPFSFIALCYITVSIIVPLIPPPRLTTDLIDDRSILLPSISTIESFCAETNLSNSLLNLELKSSFLSL